MSESNKYKHIILSLQSDENIKVVKEEGTVLTDKIAIKLRKKLIK